METLHPQENAVSPGGTGGHSRVPYGKMTRSGAQAVRRERGARERKVSAIHAARSFQHGARGALRQCGIPPGGGQVTPGAMFKWVTLDARSITHK